MRLDKLILMFMSMIIIIQSCGSDTEPTKNSKENKYKLKHHEHIKIQPKINGTEVKDLKVEEIIKERKKNNNKNKSSKKK